MHHMKRQRSLGTKKAKAATWQRGGEEPGSAGANELNIGDTEEPGR